MKCPVKIFLSVVLGVHFYASGQTQTISGRVIDSATAAPIPNATVSLVVKGIGTFTDTGGHFALTFSTTGAGPTAEIKHSTMHFAGIKIFFSMVAKELVRLDLYDIRGRKVASLLNRTFDAGNYSFSIPALMHKNTGAGFYIVKILKGEESFYGTVLSMGATGGSVADKGYTYVVNGFSPVAITASLDSLPASRMGYVPKVLPITSYTTQNVGNIALSRTDEEKSIAKKVDSLLALMSVAEKAGQMVQARKHQLTDANVAALGIGSVFNGGGDPEGNNTPTAWASMIDALETIVVTSGPHKIPFIYGQDCVHGVGSVAGCTVFPHNIGLGCTHDSALVCAIGRVVASEAAGCGIRLTFGPCVASPRNEKWGRTYEGFGETPEINAQMGAAYVRGAQGDGTMSKDSAIAPCVKHYLGDGGTANGTNAGTATLADSTMRGIHFAQYAACARENMATIMPSYSKWARTGGPIYGMTYDSIAYRMVKKEAGFDGFAVSDWDAIVNPNACGSYSNSCVAQAVNAGLDMAMIVNSGDVTNFINAIVNQAGGAIPQSRIDDAVRRILRIKFRMHLFDHPLSNATTRGQIFSASHQAIARQAVRESMVLLKNNNSALPLTTTQKIVVVGPFANDIGVQCGGWTISWQGQSGNPSNQIVGQTILAGMQSVGNSANITNNGSSTTIPSGTDRIVVVVGESPYAEGNGDNLNNLDLTNTNNAGTLISGCWNNRGTARVIVILLSGRPMIIDSEIVHCDAFVAAWLPGSEGVGVADVLYGSTSTYNFTGTLTHTWPATYAQIPINTGKVYADEPKGSGGTPLFNYGYGLRYP